MTDSNSMGDDRTGQVSLHLLRLVSPILPVGAFSYSRGLEAAVDRGWIRTEEDAQEWIHGTLEHVFAALDAPLFLRMMKALDANDSAAFLQNDTWLRASRESRELQMEDRLMGDALQNLLRDLAVDTAAAYAQCTLSFAAAFAIAARHWEISSNQALSGLMWIAAEGQVSAAMRLVPLGQTSGQRILLNVTEVIERSVRRASQLGDAEIGNTAFGLSIASAWHEEQYSRLFRS